MGFLVSLFWICFFILFYCWIGYGLIVLLTRLPAFTGKKKNAAAGSRSEVTLIIAAYLEDSVLERKILNCLSLRYPVKVIIVVDGQTSQRPLAEKYPGVTFIFREYRGGKYNAIKTAMSQVTTPFVVFSDANAMLNEESIDLMLRHYANPRTGGVAGEKKINREKSSGLGEAEGLYWKYESVMKRCDDALFTVTGAAGELYSIRTDLFRELDDDIVVDDLVISMQVCMQGYRIAYEPGAYSVEESPAGIHGEKIRRVRIAAGVFSAMKHLGGALNPFRKPLLSFQFFSRRVLRWFVSPLILPILFIVNLLLIISPGAGEIYQVAFGVQVFLYVAALAGWLILRSGRKAGLLCIPFYFVFMNYCMVAGFIRFLGKKQPAAWEKTER